MFPVVRYHPPAPLGHLDLGDVLAALPDDLILQVKGANPSRVQRAGHVAYFVVAAL